MASLKMPDDPTDIREFINKFQPDWVVIEMIPKWCGGAQFEERMIPGSAMAVLYGNFQLCIGICVGLHQPWHPISPLKWQNLVGCRNITRLDKGDWKRKLQAHAQAEFGIEIAQWGSDAILIAWAGELLFQA